MPVGSASSTQSGTPSSPSTTTRATPPQHNSSSTTTTTSTSISSVVAEPSQPNRTGSSGSISSDTTAAAPQQQPSLPPSGESTIDAAHIHFRERLGPLQTYHCHTCDDRFQAHSLLAVMEHFVRHSSTCSRFHSACLYCGGKVHSYCLEETQAAGDGTTTTWTEAPVGEAGGGRRYYHDCGRWRRRQDR